jgi:hypothetical protein
MLSMISTPDMGFSDRSLRTMNFRRPLGAPSVCVICFHIANDIADVKQPELNISLVDAESVFSKTILFLLSDSLRKEIVTARRSHPTVENSPSRRRITTLRSDFA